MIVIINFPLEFFWLLFRRKFWASLFSCSLQGRFFSVNLSACETSRRSFVSCVFSFPVNSFCSCLLNRCCPWKDLKNYLADDLNLSSSRESPRDFGCCFDSHFLEKVFWLNGIFWSANDWGNLRWKRIWPCLEYNL